MGRTPSESGTRPLPITARYCARVTSVRCTAIDPTATFSMGPSLLYRLGSLGGLPSRNRPAGTTTNVIATPSASTTVRVGSTRSIRPAQTAACGPRGTTRADGPHSAATDCGSSVSRASGSGVPVRTTANGRASARHDLAAAGCLPSPGSTNTTCVRGASSHATSASG